jgi:RHS repeat-associated protein
MNIPMNFRLALLAALASGSAFAAYTYDYSQAPVISDATRWQTNGTATFTSAGVTFPGAGGSLISQIAISGASAADCEINTTLGLTSTAGGTYILFFRTDSASDQPGVGNYLSVELTTLGTGGGSVSVRQSSSGTSTQLSVVSIAVHDGMTFRATIQGTELWVYADNFVIQTDSVPTMTGNPGIGGYSMPSGTGFTSVKLGPHDSVAPNSVIATSVASSVYPTQVSLKWQGTTDDANGIGLYNYQISRNGSPIGTVFTPTFYDSTVSASTAYTYQIVAVDQHTNLSTATSVSVSTPVASAVDPRRVGVQKNGSYWGGGGEQIDTLSGNLNFSIPVVTAQGRTSWKVPLVLSYNSQNWRQDGTVNWQLGAEVGYGYGWSMGIGSITPYYQDWTLGVDHYVFTDALGTPTILDQNSSGTWRSQPGIKIWFEAAANRLHFGDGSFWVMGSTSGGTEADSGTMYPTVMEDISGNQIIVTYLPGAGLPSTAMNTSSRITSVEDTRAQNSVTYTPYSYSSATTTGRFTYTFTYNNDAPVPHLVSVANWIGTGEFFSFTYNTGVTLAPPFGSDPSYAGLTTAQLTSASVALTGNYAFTYDTAGASELLQATLPGGGHFRWSYVSFQYNSLRSLREVGTRYLAADSAGATEWSYPFTHPDAANSVTLHTSTTLADASGSGAKTWNFITPAGSPPVWELGLASDYLEKATPTSGSGIRHTTYQWSTDPAGGVYLQAKTLVLDEGTSNAQSVKTSQSEDQYGNALDSSIYPYNDISNPRTYQMHYLNDNTYAPATTPYIENYLRNKMISMDLDLPAGVVKPLVRNTYDGYNFGGSDYCNPYASVSIPSLTITNEMDPSPPVAVGSRAILSEGSNPSYTSCYLTYNHGAMYQYGASSGHTGLWSADAATNYAAPQTITTESTSATIAYNAWLGISQTTGPNGEQLQVSYDTAGRPLTGTSPFGAVTTYAYTAAGVIPIIQTKTGPDGFTRATLDGVGRTIRLERGTSATAIQSVVDTVYAPCACSPLGKMKKVSQPYASGASVYWTTYTYDAVGRTISVQMPDGASTTTFSYSGNQTTVTDPAGNAKTMTSDSLGNLTSVVEPNPGGSGTLTTSYAYDWMNHVSQVTMTRGSTTQTRTFTYNDQGDLTSSVTPESGTVSYYYNPNHTLWYKHDANGQDTVYTYDSALRVTEIQRYPTGRSNAEDTCARVMNYYNTNPFSGTFSANTVNRLAAASFGSWGTPGGCLTGENQHGWYQMYSYHAAGVVTSKQLAVSGGSAVTASYTYDSAGRTLTRTYPMAIGGSTVSDTFTSAFDGMGRPVSLTGSESPSPLTWAQNAQYDFAGRLNSLQYLAGSGYTTETKGFNANGQLTSLAWSGSGTPVTGSLQYSYPATQNNGQVTQVVDSVSGETVVYQYDSLKRLTSAASTPNAGSSVTAWTQTYQYDGFGNMTGQVLNGTSTSIAADPTTNRLSSALYDSNGNMTSGVGATFTFDVANRVLSAAEVSGGVEYYGYAPDNKRIYKKLTSGSEEYTFYGGSGERLGVYNLSGSTMSALRTDVWFAGMLISENSNAVFQDRVGTNRASGSQFRPYGDEITSTANDREKFATYTRDSYTGVDYADQRYYASTYGRFNTADPYRGSGSPSDPSSWNRYAYTRGDPVNGSDPRGLCAVMIAGITMGPNPSGAPGSSGAAWQTEATNLVADTAYPYQGQGKLASIGSVISQLLGPNLSTYVAYEAIGQSIVSDADPVDIIAYSGGAGAFAAAYNLLTSWQKSRIGNILYVAPGSAGATLPTGTGNTTVEWGSGFANFGATILTSAPQGASVIDTGCAHTALGCFFQNAGTALDQIAADGQCFYPEVYTRDQVGGVAGIGAPGVGIIPPPLSGGGGPSWPLPPPVNDPGQS